MGKKNEFIFTIQFNPNNPIHQKTVQYLNQLSHKKADYIAQAIAAYQETAAEHSPSPFSSDKALKEYILQVIKEYEQQHTASLPHSEEAELPIQKIESKKNEKNKRLETPEQENWNEILLSLNAFRQD